MKSLRIKVSTHSRLKAAGVRHGRKIPIRISFNTQPPEGGWVSRLRVTVGVEPFNTQPPEGGWGIK